MKWKRFGHFYLFFITNSYAFTVQCKHCQTSEFPIETFSQVSLILTHSANKSWRRAQRTVAVYYFFFFIFPMVQIIIDLTINSKLMYNIWQHLLLFTPHLLHCIIEYHTDNTLLIHALYSCIKKQYRASLFRNCSTLLHQHQSGSNVPTEREKTHSTVVDWLWNFCSKLHNVQSHII